MITAVKAVKNKEISFLKALENYVNYETRKSEDLCQFQGLWKQRDESTLVCRCCGIPI